MVVSLLTGLLVCTLLWSVQDPLVLIGWFLALLLSALSRAVLFLLYWLKRPVGIGVLQWETPYGVTLLVSAAIWGIGLLLIQPQDSLLHQVLGYFFVVGLAGGAVGVYSAHRGMMLYTIGLLMIPETIWMLLQGSLVTTLIAAGSVLFLITIYRTGEVLYSHMHQSFLLAHVLAGDRDDAERRARQDELTGLPNRRAFYERAEGMLQGAEEAGRRFSLILLDVDLFKTINDTHGHAAGDRVLRHIGGLLRRELRSNDNCARIGGEEFAILLPLTGREKAVVLAEKLCRRIAGSAVSHGPDGRSILLRVTASFGVASGGGDIDRLFNEADAALYRAKGQGRNRVVAAACPN